MKIETQPQWFSVRELTDSAGAVHARYDYDAHGRRTKTQGDLDCALGFAGLQSHAPSGLNSAVFRDYDAGIGKWLNRDPMGERGGINLYTYVRNNPINGVDPTGLSQTDVRRILQDYDNATEAMNEGGMRVGWAPPLSSLNSDMYEPLWGTGKGWECVRQSEFVVQAIRSDRDDEPFDDQWSITTVTSPNLMHTWVQATSTNPLDPTIKLDPWWGGVHQSPYTINTIPNAPASPDSQFNVPSISNTHVNSIPFLFFAR